KSTGFNGIPKIKPKAEGWEKLYGPDKGQVNISNMESEPPVSGQEQLISYTDDESYSPGGVFQIMNKYLVSVVKSGLMIIDHRAAYERILFEGFMNSLEGGRGMSQQQLFPSILDFSPGDIDILKGLVPDLKVLGFDLEEFGTHSFIVNGVPVDLNNNAVSDVLENIIENFKKNLRDLISDKKINLARSLAVQMAASKEKKLEKEEMISVIDRLFACSVPDVSPSGRPIVRIITLNELDQMMK
ncbi:MAG: DNA mismatch repair protein MutL, partial [Bacteroidetes bacterium]|nr:DNA mismatch repair protein MutL [Bacteroidota bacterium]